MRWVLIFALLVTAGCADWPDTGAVPLSGGSSTWPTLMPLDEMVGMAQPSRAGDEDAARLAARAAGLRARASIMRQSIRNQADMDALRARLAR